MYDTFKTAFTGFAVKTAVVFHFVLEFAERILDQSVSDLLQGTTSVLSIIFIGLKSYETYTNIKTKPTTKNTTINVHQQRQK